VVDGGENIASFDDALVRLGADERVSTLAGIHVLFDIHADGLDGTKTLVVDLQRGDVGASIIEGRIPSAPDEVALGPTSLDRIGKRVGDVVTMRGAADVASLQIVGSVLFPEGDFSHDEGILLTAGAADRLGADVRSVGVHQVLFDWQEGIDAAVADQELRDAGFNVYTNVDALKPATVTNLAGVVGLPRFLAAFVAALTLVTLLHALAVALRYRSGEMMAMRALGMTARGTAGVLGTHVVVLAGVACVVGLPLGLVIGRAAWRPIAERSHVIVFAAWPTEAIPYAIGTLVLGACMLALVATRRVSRMRPSELLHSE
jgi:hypothetical protein